MLPDHLIRPLEHAIRNYQADLVCCLQVNDEFKLRWLLDRQVTRFCTLEDFVHVNRRAPIEVSVVRPIRHETALIYELLLEVNSRQLVFAGKVDDPLSFGEKGARGGRDNRLDLFLLRGLKGNP